MILCDDDHTDGAESHLAIDSALLYQAFNSNNLRNQRF